LLQNGVNCCMKGIHIGKLIQLRLDQLGMTKAEFARRINKTPQNVHDLLTRESVDTNLLVTISGVLNYNFFKAFMPGNKVQAELKRKKIFMENE
jgi:hypothetical protein